MVSSRPSLWKNRTNKKAARLISLTAFIFFIQLVRIRLWKLHIVGIPNLLEDFRMQYLV